jgi:hypothetical protein
MRDSTAVTCFFLFVFISFAVFTHAQDKSRVQVMVLGTYHLSNPGKDMMNIQSDDVLSAKRQQDLEQLKNVLSTFKPDKIAFEHPYTDRESINESYQNYLKDGDLSKLGRSEDYQIVFRLARHLGHQEVFPIDHKMGDFSKLQPFLERNPPFAQQFQSKLQETAKVIAEANERLKRSTIPEFLAFLNSSESLNMNHSFYSMLLSFGQPSEFVGPEIVSDWYRRNMIIFHQLTQVVNPEKDKCIIVVFGQGHAKLLRDFISEYPHFELVDPLDYLKPQ